MVVRPHNDYSGTEPDPKFVIHCLSFLSGQRLSDDYKANKTTHRHPERETLALER
jgi:hypothetical protein